MEALNINYVGGNTSNYRLRGEPVKLALRELKGVKPDGDGWEEVWDESYGTERYRSQVKPGLPRKQAAARQAIPLATVKRVEINRGTVLAVDLPTPLPKPVTMALLEGRSDDEIKIAALEAKIQELLGLIKGGR